MTTLRNISATVFMMLAALSHHLPQANAEYQYQYNPSDFATEWLEYVEGAGHTQDPITSESYTNPATSLGRPTVDSTGDDWDMPIDMSVPVVSVYPAFRSFELVSVGHWQPAVQGYPEIPQGKLILKFDHPVINHPNNPYGIDFNIFGNAAVGSSANWTNGDPNTITLSGSTITEPATVSVSQYENGPWYSFTDGPYADDFAPTLGREYNPAEPYRPDDPSDHSWDWNMWWGHVTFPTMPVDPLLSFSDFTGLTVADQSQAYQHELTGITASGGGGFDLDWLNEPGLDWIQYIRIDGPEYGSAEIDAVADVIAVIPGDADLDGFVNAQDLGNTLANYGRSDNPGHSNADFNNDGFVNALDLGTLLANYGQSDSLPTMPEALPEPSSIAILLIITTVLSCNRRSRV